MERRDAKAASTADKIAIDRIETLFQENRTVVVGSGRSADVVILDIWNNGTTKPWVVKQEVRRTREQKLLNTSLEGEMQLHDLAYLAVESAMEENPGKPFARIPKPLSLLKDTERQWLLMDYLPGDNLFVHTLRAHLLNFETDDEAKERIALMTRDELIVEITSDTFINTLPARLVQELSDGTLDELGEQHWRMIALGVNRSSKGPSVVFNARQHEALANTIDALHKAGIHHRDLHPGNVQILPDGSVGLLDFGLSTIAEKDGTKDKGLYTVDVGHEFDDKKVTLLADDECLKGFWDVARKIA